MTTLIYQAYNLKNDKRNDKRYVGLTEKGLRVRKMKHFGNAARGQQGKFYTAIRKHGPGAFLFSELVSCRDYQHGLEVERLYIEILRPEYNLTSGGGGVKGLKFSAESKAKMSAAKKGKKGHPCPEWLKLKNSELRRAEHNSIHNKRRRRATPVYSITDNLTFETVKAAALHYSTTSPRISYWCSNKRQSRSGLKLRYAKENS